MERLTIETETRTIEMLPRLGGSVAAFDLKRGGERLPVFRRWSGETESPRTFACIPMVALVRRISSGGITWRDTFYPIARNDPEDTTHCMATVAIALGGARKQPLTGSSCGCAGQAIPPFDYEATFVYTLFGAALEISLSVRTRRQRLSPTASACTPGSHARPK